MNKKIARLLVKFESLREKYEKQREFFRGVLEKLGAKRNQALYKKGKQLLADADHLALQLQDDFELKGDTYIHQVALSKKLKTFKKIYKELYELSKSPLRQWIEAIVVALGLALVLRNLIFGLYHVPTGSAETTILVGDRLWGNKMAYLFGSKIKHSDMVIFDQPEATFKYAPRGSFKYYWQRFVGLPIPLLGLEAGPANWVKRVIACPGDTIEGKIEDGKTTIYLNGKKLDEPYVNKYPLIAVRRNKGFIPLTHIGPLVIPSLLRYEEIVQLYSYDPSKSLSAQPFYYMSDSDIERRAGSFSVVDEQSSVPVFTSNGQVDNTYGQPIILHPFTSTYNHGINMDTFGPYIVPAGKYWVMGDSRKNSADSRWWLFLDEHLIHGRASFVIYSVDSEESFWLFDLIKHPIDFWIKHVRWNRFFKGLN